MLHMLVPLNGSILADWCLAWADELAAALPAEVELLRVVSGPAELADVETPLAQGRRVKLPTSGLVRAARRLHHTEHVRTHIVEGSAAAEIVARARTWPADLVLMTSHGRYGLRRALLGSVASTVIREAGVPVLVVRAELAASPPRVPRRILVPLDGSELAAQVLPPVTRLARPLGATVTLLAVVDPAEAWPPAPASVTTVEQPLVDRYARATAYVDQMASDLRATGMSVEGIVRVGPPGDMILQTAPFARVDLIAMSTHGRAGLDRLAIGSVAETVLHHADVPLLLLHPLEPPGPPTIDAS
jgi:nucleotide-binding universal stress UspA family protein